MAAWIYHGLPCSISNVQIYYGPPLDIRVKSYDRLNFPPAFVLNFECLYILQAIIEHLSQSYGCLNFLELSCSISRIWIYYGLQPNIRVKIYGRLTLLGAFVFNFKHLDKLWVSIRHLSQKLWPFEFSHNFHVKFRESLYIMGHNQTSKSKFIVVSIFLGHLNQFRATQHIMSHNQTSKSEVITI